jgi:hypothetical protein
MRKPDVIVEFRARYRREEGTSSKLDGCSPEVPRWDLDPAAEPQIGDVDIPRLAPEPISARVVRPASVLRSVPLPVRLRERLAALADAPQQVREVDQVLGN